MLAHTLTSTTLRAAADGDRAARAALLRAHGSVVWALCRRIAVDPEDAYRDVWILVFEHLDQYDPDGVAAFSTWLHTVAYRKLIDRGRSQTRAARTLRAVAETVPGTSLVTLDGQVTARAALERGLAALTEDQRRVVMMFHCAALSLEAIAEAEGVAVGTVNLWWPPWPWRRSSAGWCTIDQRPRCTSSPAPPRRCTGR